MVGMEQVEVHSKSYLVRWIQVQAGHTISWSIQPHKKSLNFGIFKHPGGASGLPTPIVPSGTSLEPPPTATADSFDATTKKKGPLPISRNDTSTVVHKLENLGMKCVAWTGKCEADKVTMGKFEVTEGEGGMFGLVFDNTFSKQVSKTATFVLMTYLSDAPPTSGHHLHFSQASAAASSSASLPVRTSPGLPPAVSTDSLPQDVSRSFKSIAADPRPRSGHAMEIKSFGGSAFYTGVLNKQRRKNKTYAKRFFSLDFTTSTLSYYRNRNSSALRGAVPLSLAAVGMNESSREISVDSGAEVWHLKAGNQKDFTGWRDALERASRVAASISSQQLSMESTVVTGLSRQLNVADDQDWDRVEALVGSVAGIRDAVRRLAQDTDPKYRPTSSAGAGAGTGAGNDVSITPTPSSSEAGSFDLAKEDNKTSERPAFWKRKTSTPSASRPSALFKRSFSAQLAVPGTASAPIPVPNSQTSGQRIPYTSGSFSEEPLHDHCMAILQNLNQVVSDFSALLAESKQRRLPPMENLSRRQTSGSMSSSDEFFDAQDGDTSIRSQLLQIRRDSQEFVEEPESLSDAGSESSLDSGEISSFKRRRTTTGDDTILFPTKAKTLAPLPLSPVQRRKTVPAPRQAPPSLISFLRKNVGKDLATIAMPVSANEPTSALQRVAEQLEYSELIDAAITSSDETTRLLNITAFAVASFSNNRIKERAIRKPFNPMLGETFELVREDKGFRLLSEKISHRPVRIAIQAEGKDWTFLQSPMPVQKFWGKSAELNTEGRARIFLHSSNEVYSYTLATSFLRNVIAGEKYIEPVSTMTVANETSGGKAVVTFKAGGMFAGRSEEVSIQAFDAKGISLGQGLAGKWTSHLNITQNGQDTGKTIWKTGSLVDNASQSYGFTSFAAGVNEITSVEQGHLPPTDSRLRPDQRAVEEGDMDHAEALKARLEERQRGRRRVMEEHGEEWKPKWFINTGTEGDEEIWRLKTGKDGYWEERAKGEWKGVVDVFQS